MHQEDDALMTIRDLRDELARRGIIDVPRSTIRNWYLIGIESDGSRQKLPTKRLGARRMTSVRLTIEFLEHVMD